MSNRLRRGASIAAAAALVGLGSSTADALPKEGEKAPTSARLEDADGRVLDLKALKGKPILIMYEHKDSSQQNQAFKEELSKLAKGDKYKATIALAAIADLTAYDFWPAKGFVKDAIREESKKAGTAIYCDWSGTFRGAFKLRAGTSNVVLVGKDGVVLFAAEGALKPAARKRLLDLLKEQVEG